MSESWFDYDRFIKPTHLGADGATLQITGVGEVDSAIKKDEKQPVLFFAANPAYPLLRGKQLPVNTTNRDLLIRTFGHEKKSCIGKWVHLRAGKAQNGKDTVILLIASEPKPAKPATAKLDQARIDHLKELRTQLETSGGTPRDLKWIKFTPDELEQEIAATEQAIRALLVEDEETDTATPGTDAPTAVPANVEQEGLPFQQEERS